MRQMSEHEKKWLEAFEKLENFNDGRELELLGVNISRRVKRQMNRQDYARKTQLVEGKKSCTSLNRLEEIYGGEFLSNQKFEYTGKGVLARQKKAQEKIKQELVALDNHVLNFNHKLTQAGLNGKSNGQQHFTEIKTKNGRYSKLTLAEKLLARMQAKFYQDNNMESRIGIFNEGDIK